MYAHQLDRFDDIEDNSKLRQGMPVAHMLYGTAQAINSAVFALANAFSTVQRLTSPKATQVFIGEWASTIMSNAC